MSDPRVLSIQSHVVHGYVGNKSACFPLQVLGIEVDFINSVQFSNHTGYKTFKGQVLTNKDLETLIDGLKANGIDKYSHLLTGYIGSKSFLETVFDVVQHLKQKNPDLVYVCDPVMGDNGKMYVPEELLPVYREHIVPLADIITPNQYEAELLSGISINSEEDLITVMDWFHSKGVKTVVLSSTDLGTENELLCMASTILKGVCTRLHIKVPRFPVNYTGTGDLFASLLLGWMHKTDNDLKKSVEHTMATMQKILQRTLDKAREQVVDGQKLSVQHLELKIVQSLDDIRNPPNSISATVLTD